MRNHNLICGLFGSFMLTISVFAGEVNLPHTFQPNTKAKASEVNANFNAVRDAVNDNNSRIQNLENLVQQLQQQNQQLQQQVQQLQQQVTQFQNTITQLQNTIAQLQTDVGNIDSRVGAIESSNVMAMDAYIQVTTPDPNANSGALITFEGVNLQIVNGTGQTNQVNGLGNLIIGYNTDRRDTTLRPTCSLGQYWNNSTNCTANGGTWGLNFKTGSHNLIVGDQNAYSSYGGIVAGFGNVISREFAVVTGGYNNIASGTNSSVSGGYLNTASGTVSSVSGGHGNTASGPASSISGGHSNIASGDESSISGGANNIASGTISSISGGRNNTAGDPFSAISGGDGCTISDDSTNNAKWGAKKSDGTLYGDCP